MNGNYLDSGNRKFLNLIGITNKKLQQIAIETIPCGEKLIENVMNDKTSVVINAPRALIIMNYKGMIAGLAASQKIIDDILPDLDAY